MTTHTAYFIHLYDATHRNALSRHRGVSKMLHLYQVKCAQKGTQISFTQNYL